MEFGYYTFNHGKFGLDERDNLVEVPSEFVKRFNELQDAHGMEVVELRYDFRNWFAKEIKARLNESGYDTAIVTENGLLDPTQEGASKEFDVLIGYPMVVTKGE